MINIYIYLYARWFRIEGSNQNSFMKMDKKNEKSYLYADNIQFTVHNQEMKRENI